MSELETFTQLPLHIDPATKSISSTSNSKSLQSELSALNALHKQLLTLDSPTGTPPAPIPVNPSRSASIAKLRTSANTAHTAGKYEDAHKLYTLALQMALTRPLWEPSGLVRDEVAGLYANRAQTNMSQRKWVEGLADARSSTECKKGGNAKAWWRGGKCLCEMGRFEEAGKFIEGGLEVESGEKELLELKRECERRVEERRMKM